MVEHEPGPKTKKTHISGWASGGSGAFRKSIWDKLGGFDSLYYPFYWEDIDLSYRAWKRGYKILWEPKAAVHHKHEAIIGRHYSKKYINFVSERNRLLFIWKNIGYPEMFLQHNFYLMKKLFTFPSYWRPFLAALTRLPKILYRRFKECREKKINDKQVFEQFS